ncbi:hypothetical protein J7E96_11320 [Streptomyces sp. ISL-96]|uniref:hypothetical protein n=1 Tax=Streptomyces sp. ISL-96 TaxID=2819191 RepID=UPI001BEBA427|nr:hypothetical protein [Streptomyces sp. ISL-96]MBT2489102.1 hypothetical protein [Streptomyces sp. ISL-96]
MRASCSPAAPEDEDASYAAFAVRRTAHRGSLAQVGNYDVQGGRFAVELIDRGRDRGGRGPGRRVPRGGPDEDHL